MVEHGRNKPQEALGIYVPQFPLYYSINQSKAIKEFISPSSTKPIQMNLMGVGILLSRYQVCVQVLFFVRYFHPGVTKGAI